MPTAFGVVRSVKPGLFWALPIFLMSVWCPAQVPCINGMAGIYPCQHVDLMAHLTPEQLGGDQIDGRFLNDLWGWTDPLDLKEYALVGLVNGVAFVEVTNPSSPIYLGLLLEHNSLPSTASRGVNHLQEKSIWRDIKVYQNHAFVVSEDTLHGMQVFDLTLLRDRSEVPRNFVETAHYNQISNSHNLAINQTTGFAYSLGGNKTNKVCGEGGLHIIDIRDPKRPTYAGCYDQDGYTHDAQVVIYKGTDEAYVGREIAFSSNEDALNITDVTNKTNPINIAIQTYDSVGYMHQGWLTEDHQYFLSNDERDEFDFGTNTRTLIWDVRDLDRPVHIGSYFSSLPSVDHNLYNHQGYTYQSNYTSGLRILNAIQLPDTLLSEAAYFDTFVAHDNPEFDGAWSNYPFFGSGTVLVSDVQNGLFILRPNLKFEIQQQPVSVIECSEISATSFIIQTQDLTHAYQWQRDQGQGFKNLQEDVEFSGVKSVELGILIRDSSIVKDAFRCVVTDSSNRFMVSDTVYVNVEPFVEVSFEVEVRDQTVILENTSTKRGDLVWDLGDGQMVMGVDVVEHVYDTNQNFEIELRISNACGTDTLTKRVDVFTAIQSASPSPQLSLFPNPTNSWLTLQLPEHISKARIKVLDGLGREVIAPFAELEALKIRLNVAHLEPGIYFLVILNEGNGSESISRFVVN